MDITVQVDTSNLVLHQKSQQINEMIARSVSDVIEKVFAESQILVPVNTGALKASGQVVKESPEENGALSSSYITYGDATVDYAVSVHEDLSMPHAAPTQAKYLETPLVKNVPLLESLIRARLKVILYS